MKTKIRHIVLFMLPAFLPTSHCVPYAQQTPVLPSNRQFLAAKDITQAQRFIVKIRDSPDPVSRYVKERCSPDVKVLIDHYDGSWNQSEKAQSAILQVLNEIIRGPCFYEMQRFAKVRLKDTTLRLLRRNPVDDQLLRLNRFLLEDAYPDEIASSRQTRMSVRISLDVITETLSNGELIRKFYSDEDITIVIYISNLGCETEPVKTPAQDWRKQIGLALQKDDNGKWMVIPSQMRVDRESSQIHPAYRDSYLQDEKTAEGILGPGKQLVVSGALLEQGGQRPGPGRYRLVCTPTSTFDSSQSVTATEEFEVSPVVTQHDRINSLCHRAVRDRWAKRYDSAEMALKTLFDLDPNSLSAHFNMAMVEKDRQNYAKAIEWFQKAIKLLESDSGVVIVSGKRQREDLIVIYQQHIKQCESLAQSQMR